MQIYGRVGFGSESNNAARERLGSYGDEQRLDKAGTRSFSQSENPPRTQRKLQVASKHENVKFVAADFEFIDIESRPFAYSSESCPTPSAWLVRRDVLLAAPFHPTAVEGEDYDWLRKTKHMVNRLRVPDVLLSYRIRHEFGAGV